MGKNQEDEQVLCERGSSRGRTIAAGAVHQLRAWPDLFGVILTGCLLSGLVLVLVVLPAVLAITPGICNRRFLEHGANSINVYFLKHENRTWTREELCHIETAARQYPEYNIIMINLKSQNESKSDWNIRYYDNFLDYFVSSEHQNSIDIRNNHDTETSLRYKLSGMPNVLNIDMRMDRFFAGSAVKRTLKDLSEDVIELAGKFQAIWDLPGIALDPLLINQLEAVSQLIDRGENNIAANFQIDSDLQATSVPCQSFIGHVISQIARNSFTDRKSTLEYALNDYCPSVDKCTGVRIIKPIVKRSHEATTCPIIFAATEADRTTSI